MPLVGQKAPDFTMVTTKNLNTLDQTVSLESYKGKWLVLFFYPLDFTFVCPTEITGFSLKVPEFAKLGAEVLGVSTDSIHSHKAWINQPRTEGGLGALNFPLASDITKQVARDYGVLIEEKGIALRGLFVIDPEGVVQYQVVHSLNVGRSVDEVIRVLEALQSGGLCAMNWHAGDANL